MISFTGSTEVGKLMLRYAGESNMKRVSLECGGKSPHVVMADADIKAAAEAIAWGIYYNQGETCHAGSRVLAHSSIRAELVAAIAEVARAQIPLGHPFDAGLADRRAGRESIIWSACSPTSSSARRRARRSRSAASGSWRTPAASISSRPFSTTRATTCASRRRRFSARWSSSFPSRTRPRRSRLANDTIYGLAAAVWTADMNVAHRLSRAIRAGTVWVNTYDRSSLTTPFGGFKQSGFGRDRSPHAIDKYMDFKTIWTAYN